MKHSDDQLQLRIQEKEEEVSLRCRGVFSVSYLRQHLADSVYFPSLQETEPIYAKLKARWQENLPGFRRRKEAYTRTHFSTRRWELGWFFIPEQDLPAKTITRKRPDYCLFGDEDAQRRAAKQDHPTDVFRESASVLEAKKWRHSLDEVSEEETPGWFPSQQIQDYLRHAKDATGQRFFNWAILTNGNEWRLYCEQAPWTPTSRSTWPTNDSSVRWRISVSSSPCSARRLSSATNGRCLSTTPRESLTCQAELGTNLRKRIFDVLEDLANGLPRATPTTRSPKPTSRGSTTTRSSSSTGCCSSSTPKAAACCRSRPSGPGANKRYRENFSLARLVGDSATGPVFTSDDFTDSTSDLLKLFHLINGDQPKQNEACNVTRYNGGLFDPEAASAASSNGASATIRWPTFSANSSLPSRRPAPPPASSRSPPTRPLTTARSKSASLATSTKACLAPNLRRTNGRLVLGQRKRRKPPPRHLLHARLDCPLPPPRNASAAARRDRSQPRSADGARRPSRRKNAGTTLSPSRCCGLTSLIPRWAAAISSCAPPNGLPSKSSIIPTTRPMTEQIVAQGDRRRSRDDIVKDGKIPVSPGISQEHAEKAYWRRRVVEACIYGVDINPLAVELAKLSLWLTCIAVDEPLNFLDHHLRRRQLPALCQPRRTQPQPASPPTTNASSPPSILGDDCPRRSRAVIAENVQHRRRRQHRNGSCQSRRKNAGRRPARNFSPFLNVADLWLAALDGVPINELDYRTLALLRDRSRANSTATKSRRAKKAHATLADLLRRQRRRPSSRSTGTWNFPMFSSSPTASPRPDAERGFDASSATRPTSPPTPAAPSKLAQCCSNTAPATSKTFTSTSPISAFNCCGPAAVRLHRLRHVLHARQQAADARTAPKPHAHAPRPVRPVRCHRGRRHLRRPQRRRPPTITSLLFIQARPRKDADGKPTEPEQELP